MYDVEINPTNYQIRYRNLRGAPLKKFPFLIMYEIFKNDVIVHAVFNTHQNPDKLK